MLEKQNGSHERKDEIKNEGQRRNTHGLEKWILM